MAADDKAPIIKKVKKVVAAGHHGGAWKVAYADFVTAMMAFFLLMWLLNATTEKQRKGLADYFSPTIPIARVSGGGDGTFGGDSAFTEDDLPESGDGGLPVDPTLSEGGGSEDVEADADAESAELEKVEELLFGTGGESMASEEELRHIVTRVTDEGLLIDLFDLEDSSLFQPGTDTPTALLTQLISTISRVFVLVTNDVAIGGHMATQAVVVVENNAWPLSSARANKVRMMLEQEDFPARRIQRVTGHADREPITQNVMNVRNNRIELILLRSGK